MSTIPLTERAKRNHEHVRVNGLIPRDEITSLLADDGPPFSVPAREAIDSLTARRESVRRNIADYEEQLRALEQRGLRMVEDLQAERERLTSLDQAIDQVCYPLRFTSGEVQTTSVCFLHGADYPCPHGCYHPEDDCDADD